MATADPPPPIPLENTAVGDRNESLEELEVRQKREVKELHAKVLAMKKRVPKGNKKERKQVLDEVSRLELEMEDRHRREKELNGASSEKIVDIFVEKEEILVEKEDIIVEKESEGRKSRAQKKREKREAREERMNELIADMQVTQSEGDLERETLLQTLTPLGLRIYDVNPDGDCMYTAICHQLKVVRVENVDVNELRRKCAEYIRSHRTHYEQFLSDTLEPFDQYCHRIEHSKDWGGHLELTALSQSLQAHIQVRQAEGQTQTFGEAFSSPPLLLSYHKHQYHMGEHYNSLIPLDQ